MSFAGPLRSGLSLQNHQLGSVFSESNFIDLLFDGGFKVRKVGRLGNELAERIAAGGYPAALARSTARRRTAWYRDYIETLVQRDARDLASPFQLSRPTIRDYVTLLERVFLIDSLAPWHSNRLSRLVKTPKLHVGDTGVACALLGLDAAGLWQDRGAFGQLPETFIFQELRRHVSWHAEGLRFSHFRDKDGGEVDMVLERGGGQIAGVEVRAAATVTAADFRGLRKLKEAAGRKFAAGVVLYDGESDADFGDDMHAVPIRMLCMFRDGLSRRVVP